MLVSKPFSKTKCPDIVPSVKDSSVVFNLMYCNKETLKPLTYQDVHFEHLIQ